MAPAAAQLALKKAAIQAFVDAVVNAAADEFLAELADEQPRRGDGERTSTQRAGPYGDCR